MDTTRWNSHVKAPRLPVWIKCAVIAIVSGCQPGPPLGEVTGRVTIDGQPAPGLLVHFEPQDGRVHRLPPTYGATDDRGGYRAKKMNGKTGAAIGLNHVRITAIEREGNQQAIIHARYAEDYTLWFEVTPGQNTFDIKLRSDPYKRPKPVARSQTAAPTAE